VVRGFCRRRKGVTCRLDPDRIAGNRKLSHDEPGEVGFEEIIPIMSSKPVSGHLACLTVR
jgi:hypothetical protein